MKDYDNLIRQRVRQQIFEAAKNGINPASLLIEKDEKDEAAAEAPAEKGKAPAKPDAKAADPAAIEAARAKEGGKAKGGSQAATKAEEASKKDEVEIKESEIEKLNLNHENLKQEIDDNQKKYENLIDEAADQISNFVKKAKLENISK